MRFIKIFDKELFFVSTFFALLVVALFFPFFFLNKYPYPGDFMTAWYEPFKKNNFVNGKILIPHKPVAEDTFRQLYPFKVLAMDEIKKGHLPLWNTFNGLGMPLFATINIGFLDPLNLLYFIFPSYLAWSSAIIVQAFLIPICTYLYCRSLKMNPVVSIFSSSVFLLSGFVITRLTYGIYGTSVAMLPLSLYALESYLQNQRTKKILILPISIFITLVSTQPQIALYSLSFITFYYLFRIYFIKTTIAKKINNIVFPFFLFLIGIFLSAIQLFPTFELYKNTNVNTQASKEIIEHFLLPFAHLLTIAIPNYFGNQGTYNYWGAGDYTQTVASLGLITLFFSFLILAAKIRAKQFSDLSIFFGGATIISSLLALNWIGARIFLSLPIPLLSTGAPSRIFFLTTFSFSILSGLGVSYWKDLKKITKGEIFITLFFVAGIIAVVAVTYFNRSFLGECPSSIPNCYMVSVRNSLLEAFGFALFLAIFWSNNFLKRFKNIATLVFIILILFLGFYNAYKYLPFSSKDNFLPKNQLLTHLQSLTKNGAAFGLGEAHIPTNFATLYHFYDPEYYHPLYILRYRELVDYSNSGTYANLPRGDVEIQQDPKSGNQTTRRDMLLNLLGVRYLIFENNNQTNLLPNIVWRNNDWIVSENLKSLKKFTFVQNVVYENSNKKVLDQLFTPSFDPSQKTIIEAKLEKSIIPTSTFKSSYEIVDIIPNKIVLNTKTNNDSFLLLLDNYFPGWKAYIDNKETKVYRANYTFKGIEVPKGTHLIRFEYKPTSLRVGTIISILSLGVFAFFVLSGLRPKIGGDKNKR